MEKFSFSENMPRAIVVLIALLLLAWGFWGTDILNTFNIFSEKSVEVGVFSLSPKGVSGGLAIPASCPSYEHLPGECAPPAPNFSGINSDGSGGGAVTINQGEGAALNWSAPEAISCDGVNFGTGGATSGSAVVSPISDTTYSIVCNYPGNYSPTTVQSSVGVIVLNPALSISANPESVRSGRSSAITWSATNVDSCTITGPNGFSYNTVSGSAETGPLTQQSTYILVCQNAGGTVSASAVVTIIPSFEEF